MPPTCLNCDAPAPGNFCAQDGQRIESRSQPLRALLGDNSSSPTKSEAIAMLRELLEAGKITPMIDSSFPLSEVHEAFRHQIQDELHGKVILTP